MDNNHRSREGQLAHIERQIARCETLIAALHPHRRSRVACLGRRLVGARAELARLGAEPDREEVADIAAQLAQWAGNREPLPDPHRPCPRPFEGRGPAR